MLIQLDRCGDGGLRQGVEPFREYKHFKGWLVRGTEEIERGLRVLPTRYDLFAVVIDLEGKKRMIFAEGLVAVPYFAEIASTMSSSVRPSVRY